MTYMSLKWKVTGLIVAGTLIFGLVLMIFMYVQTAQVLQNELIQRGRTIAVSVSKTASELVLQNSQVELRFLAMEAKSFESVDYVLIEDDESEIISDTFNGNVPKELIKTNAFDDDVISADAFKDLLITVPEIGEVYDILVPIDEGMVGYVRVGMGKRFVDTIINHALFFSLLVIGIGVILAIIASFLLSKRITDPIIYLTKAADKISMGDFDTAIKTKSNDEIGDLGIAIERMRESLKAAIDRLRKRQKMRI